MRHALRTAAVLGVAAFGLAGVCGAEAKAQGIVIGGYLALAPVMTSVHRHHHGCGHRGLGYGYGTGYGVVAPRVYTYGSTSATNRGFIEGERYIATGRLPHHRMSPAEARGFAAGERAALGYRPW